MIAESPQQLRSILLTAAAKYSRDLFSILHKSPFSNFENGVLVTKDKFDLYWHIEFDRIQHVKQMLAESKILMNPPIAIHFGKGPVYVLTKPVDSEKIRDFSDCLINGLADHIWILDGKQGVVIDTYSGYLPNGRSTNQKEIVYEFTYYQDDEQGDLLNVLKATSNL